MSFYLSFSYCKYVCIQLLSLALIVWVVCNSHAVMSNDKGKKKNYQLFTFDDTSN